MARQLKISAGQYSDKGRKPSNQDFHGLCVPPGPQLRTKGIAVALADGISSSDVSHVAAAAAVRSLLEDYYCTSDAWSVRTSVERVLVATNSWLYAQTQQGQGRYDKDRGHVCTLSAMVLKSATAHLFHVGDARIYQVHDATLEQLTQDHRVRVSAQQSYLARALGIDRHVEIDYRSLPVEPGDVFLLATDGVHEHVSPGFVAAVIAAHCGDLEAAAREIGEEAYRQGSPDNLTVQIVRIDELPDAEAGELHRRLGALPLPPLLEPRMEFDGFRIVRELHASHRSHLHLARDVGTDALVVLKTPSVAMRDDAAYLDRFPMEEWVARRIRSAHVLQPCLSTRPRRFLYGVMEYVEGRTLAQWMIDHPSPDIETVRGIVEQIARGLRAFHRLEMLHQDLRPHNVMIDTTGTVKIIDFGAARVAGIAEASPAGQQELPGTPQYMAPEYLLGEEGTPRSDLFSLGVIAYQMLSGRLPYGMQVARIRTEADRRKLRYDPVRDHRREIPVWIDEALRKAVHPEPGRRYEDLSEFVFDLHHPNKAFLARRSLPLIERNPVMFWKGVSFVLAIVVLMLLAFRTTAR
ncbi:bifunctional protein-serine/threonine kinase/phosphatase [Caldimonas tepidiphila]|uniref:bifunctional protein-serine/threonine kinase/phosphatase n=1 Tax=Caldimonas tepidiphila TaxID=2315841 RepID=UPI000E5A88DD|nr:bifunctional protein-serine/threonine kinase/phosphatase [Caldimonas tepidiphila]